MKIPAALLLAGLLVLPAAAQPHGIPQRPDVEAYYDGVFPPTPPVIPGNWSTVIAFPNLTFLNPVGLTHIPGTNRLLVWEREGKIWSFENNPATTEKTLVLDLSANCQGWDDSGLLGVALHPDFVNNRQMWVWYCWRGGIVGGAGDLGPVLGNANTRPPTNSPTRNRLSRFTLGANGQANRTDEYVVIDQKDTSVWHNGGGMFFHPENGFLYITNGDDANPSLNTQRVDRSLFSCVIRIDVDRRGGTISQPPVKRSLDEISPEWPRYYVPSNNPFVGQPDALAEIYAIGLRSPHRMTIDPVTHRIFIGDVGGSAREEISVIEPTDPPGLNFQWSRIEGKVGDLTAPYPGTNKRPLIDYAHSQGEGSCVIGGYVYRGTAFPELNGKYIFGDNMSGIVWYLDESVSPPVKVPLATLPDGPGPNSGNDYRGLGSFGLDAAGELYLCRLSSVEGRIYKLQRGGVEPGAPLPATLGATGLFSDLASLTPDPRLIPYELNAPFWSDGAIKKRFAVIPNGTTVAFRANGDWTFPAGSVFVKHFDLPVSDADPGVTRRLETRVLVKQDDGEVYGATYKWRADQTDADLLDGSLTENVTIATESLGNLTAQDIGNPAFSGSTSRAGNLVTLTAGGNDIWGTTDQFHFAHQPRSGDFDISVRIESVVQSDLYTKTGLMVRDSLAANARHVMALVFPSNAARNNNDGGYEFQYRATAGGNAVALYPPSPQPRVNYPDTWLRLKREGDTFIAYSGSDGFTWREYARTTLDFPDQIHFGLAVTAHTTAQTTVAKFQIDTRRQPWYYPSRQDCMRCHNPQAGGVLGPSTRQFNLEMFYPNGVQDHQLLAWDRVGLFDQGPDEEDIPHLDKLAHHDDTTASLHHRTRSYLDANCSYCHRSGGVQAFWDGRFEIPFVDQGIYYGLLVNPPAGNLGARVVVPKDLASSMLHHRISITGENQMPPLARNLVDKDAVAMITEWIQSLPEENVNPPGSLTAIAVSNHRVELAWQDLSDNETGFAVERSLDGNNFTVIATIPAGETIYSDTAAEPFRTNSYRIRAIGTYVRSSPSNVAFAVPNVGPPAPEIHVTGNGIGIQNNDLTPALDDGTDFGIVSPGSPNIARTFIIENQGNLSLGLTGNPRVSITGPDAASFSIVSQPPASLAGPGSFPLEIRFTPSGYGSKQAFVFIQSNDPDEALTTFAITGMALDNGLVAWWRFDDGSGTTATDVTGFGHDGELTEPFPQWESEGRVAGALRFNGQSGQSVTVANKADLNPTGGISIATWLFADDWAGNRRVLQKGNTDNQYRLLAENGNLVWHIANVGRLEAALPPAGQWVHLAATYNGSRMILYINGVPRASLAATGSMAVTGDPIHISTKTPGAAAGDHWVGLLDDLRLYNRALGGAEVAILAEAGIADGLLAHWRLDDGAGTTAADASGAGLAGNLTSPLPTWQSQGRIGGALRFTGQTGQSVTVANQAALNPVTAISISSWVNSSGWTGNQRVLQKGNTDNQYRLMAEFGNFAWDIANVGRLEAAHPPANQWVHIAAIYDGERMVLYYDGVEVAARAASGAIPVTTSPLHLGTKTAASGALNHLDGMLDQVRLYGRALSTEEVAALAAEGSSLTIAATDAVARKGTGDTATFTVTRTGPTGHALGVPLSLSSGPGQARQGIDFALSPALSGVSIPAGQSSASLMVLPLVTPSVTGPLPVTLSLGSVSGYSITASPAQAVIEDTPFNDWKISAFGGLAAAQTSSAGNGADADADGLTTLLEAALGGGPHTSDQSLLPFGSVELIGGQLYLTATYQRPKPSIPGLSYLHRTTLSLSSSAWQEAQMVDGYPQDNQDGTETVKFRTLLPIGERPAQFLRLEVPEL